MFVERIVITDHAKHLERKFKVILEHDDVYGGYTVTVPALPGCVTEGDTIEEALANAKEAITGYLEALQLQGVVNS